MCINTKLATISVFAVGSSLLITKYQQSSQE